MIQAIQPGSSASGVSWDLNDLYASVDDAQINTDLETAQRELPDSVGVFQPSEEGVLLHSQTDHLGWFAARGFLQREGRGRIAGREYGCGAGRFLPHAAGRGEPRPRSGGDGGGAGDSPCRFRLW